MKFTPEMFGDDGRGSTRYGLQGFDKQAAAEYAQAAFDKWLAEQPVVYCDARPIERKWEEPEMHVKGKFSLSARLVAIEAIE